MVKENAQSKTDVTMICGRCLVPHVITIDELKGGVDAAAKAMNVRSLGDLARALRAKHQEWECVSCRVAAMGREQ